MARLVTKSSLIPLAALGPDNATAIRDQALQATFDMASEPGNFPTDDLVARALLPTDLTETSEIWADQTGATANTLENSIIANQTTPDNQWIGIYGVLDTSVGQFISYIKWTVGGAARAQWSVFDYFSDDTSVLARTAYTPSPLIIGKNTQVTIEYYIQGAGGTQQSTHIAYLGWVVEQADRKIGLK